MKEIQIAIRISEENGKIASALKTKGFENDSLEKILIIVGALENLKQEQLKHLELGKKINL